jgi:hypothetical protein
MTNPPSGADRSRAAVIVPRRARHGPPDEPSGLDKTLIFHVESTSANAFASCFSSNFAPWARRKLTCCLPMLIS